MYLCMFVYNFMFVYEEKMNLFEMMLKIFFCLLEIFLFFVEK